MGVVVHRLRNLIWLKECINKLIVIHDRFLQVWLICDSLRVGIFFIVILRRVISLEESWIFVIVALFVFHLRYDSILTFPSQHMIAHEGLLRLIHSLSIITVNIEERAVLTLETSLLFLGKESVSLIILACCERGLLTICQLILVSPVESGGADYLRIVVGVVLHLMLLFEWIGVFEGIG